MGLVFEHLIRKFAESANDTAGEFFAPPDVVRLVTTRLFAADHVRVQYDAFGLSCTLQRCHKLAIASQGIWGRINRCI